MKPVFKIAGSLALAAAVATAGCARSTETAAPVATDGGDAQRLVALLDYVGGDYGRAVKNGTVESEFEYEEQLRFVADAHKMAAGLLGPTPGADDRVKPGIDRVEALVRAKADAHEVTRACRAAREDVVTRFGLRTTPAERPSLARAERLYVDNCAVCHGAKGDANTDRARELDPSPASFKDRERLNALAPFRVYNALTFGVPGTAMASFDALPASDRWSLAFYVFRLGHEGDREESVAVPLADLAIRTDEELAQALRAQGHPQPDAAVAHARREVAFQEPPAGLGIDATRRMIRQALRAANAGDFAGADRQSIDAYLLGFEPLEPRLGVRDAKATLAVEQGFTRLRGAIARRDATAANVEAGALDARLVQLGGGSGTRPFVASFLIYFREGVEAALLVAALLAGLRRLGRADASRYIHAGWLAALPAGLLTWYVLERVVRLGAEHRELVEAVVGLLAAAVLFSVSFWMISKAESRHWMGYLRRQLETTLTRRSLLLLAGLSFLAVYREAAETVLFTQALLLESEGQAAQVWVGALAGLLTVAAIAVALGRSVMKLPLGPFFGVSGALLCVLSVSFAGTGLHELVLGVHPDLNGLLVQGAIVAVIALCAVATLRRRSADDGGPVAAPVDPGQPA